MSDYTKSVDFSAKDALASGDPNKIVSGTEINTEFTNIQTSNNTKSDKVVPATTNNMAMLNGSGNLADSGFLFSGTGGEVTANAAELNKTNTTASQADLDACTNFEETISATTSEVTIATGKTLNITDEGALEFGGTALTATVAELNAADGPNAANKLCLLDANAVIPFAQMRVDAFTDSVASVGATSWTAKIPLTLTNITTVYGVHIVVKTDAAYTSTPNWLVYTDDSYSMSMDDSTTSVTAPTAGDIDLYLYNPDGSTRTLSYRILVYGA